MLYERKTFICPTALQRKWLNSLIWYHQWFAMGEYLTILSAASGTDPLDCIKINSQLCQDNASNTYRENS